MPVTDQLLLDICSGAVRLRPTKTNDRSAPVVKAEGETPTKMVIRPTCPPPAPPSTAVQNGSPAPPPPPPPLPSTSLVPNKRVTAKPFVIKKTGPLNRDQLLDEIKTGVKLKRTETNDKSKPVIMTGTDCHDGVMEPNRGAPGAANGLENGTSDSIPRSNGLLAELANSKQFNNKFQ